MTASDNERRAIFRYRDAGMSQRNIANTLGLTKGVVSGVVYHTLKARIMTAEAREIERTEESLRVRARRRGYSLRKRGNTFTVIAHGLDVPFAEDWTLEQVEEWIVA